jgi:uncharacterized protein YbjQ (UPF0145 family)
LFGTGAGWGGDEDDDQSAGADRERIAQGGIPLGAEQRLKRVAAGGSSVFTSDLSAKEYALAHAAGLTPIAQIMGSSVVQNGWQDYLWSTQRGAAIVPVPSFVERWNLSRQRAFERLRQEAQFAGADAVIGIEMSTRTLPGDRGDVEFVVFGTAVRENPPRRRDSGPRMCALSGQDFVTLRRIGAEPVGVIGHIAAVGVAITGWSNQRMGSWWGNQEIPQLTEAVYVARRLAMDEVRRQAEAVRATEMVVSDLTRRIRRAGEQGGADRQIFIVSMNVLGTAIVRGAHEPQPASIGPPMMAINIGA